MADTKEKILMTALHLFAREGYEAVSVSMIAAELGITKGALYKHYANKLGIFDAILSRMAERDAQGAAESELPTESAEAAPETYCNIPPAQIIAYAKAQFRYWTQDEFAADFRRMLTLEQYRNAEMAELYHNCIVSGPVWYMEDIFREMIKNGVLKEADPKQLAVEFYAPFYLLVNCSDLSKDKGQWMELLRSQIECFMQCHAAGHLRKD